MTSQLFSLLVLLTGTLAHSSHHPASDPLTVHVTTPLGGRLVGHRIHRNFHVGPETITHYYDRFRGIAYAKPPVGDLRFKAPQPLEARDRPQETLRYPRVCPQLSFHPDTRLENQDESCLYLDVYAPYEEEPPAAPYPVMVYVHGGSYEVGSGTLYDGGVLAEMGVVVVTINYRLGVLGFLSSGDALLPGNYGLLDQVAALEWVRDHIALFRGDPGRVTLFGHSVGASSVGLMMVIPQARGLFHGVIAQSGAATAPYSTHTINNADFNEYVIAVGRLFDCRLAPGAQPGEDGGAEGGLGGPAGAALVACLRGVHTLSFITERGNFPMYDPIDPEFRPFVDGLVLPDVPRRLFEEGRFARVPIIVGTVKDEFANYFNGGERHRAEFDAALDSYVTKVLEHDPGLEDVVRFKYTDWSEEKGSFHYLRGDLLSDMHMIAPIVDMAELISRHQSEVYQYFVSVEPSFHSVELNYVFGAPFSGHFADEMTVNGSVETFSEADRTLSRRVMRIWTHFTKHGRPVASDDSNLVWPPYTGPFSALISPHTPHHAPTPLPPLSSYLHLARSDVSVRHHLRAEHVAFWNDLVPSLRNLSCLRHPPRLYSDPGEGSTGALLGGEPVNVWFLLAAVCVLLVVVCVLAVVFVKTTRDNQRYRNAIKIYAAAAAAVHTV